MSAPTPIDDLPTLGRAVRLGELYNANTKQFLGVQLFSSAIVDENQLPPTRLENPKVQLSMANSSQDRRNVININAELSLSVLSGLVTVQGSGTYLNETKSNSTASAWAMHVSVQKSKHTLNLNADALDQKKGLKWAKEKYVETGAATHFVSSILYGGSVIAQFVAQADKLEEDEKLKGELHLKLEKLAGVIGVEGKVKAEASRTAKEIRDYFDVTLHGDIDLKTVPVDAEGVLNVFSESSKLIGNGIPVSVMLRPLSYPKEDIVVHRLSKQLLDRLLKLFDNLDAVHSRFQDLQDATQAIQMFVPKLAAKVNETFITFGSKHRELVTELTALLEYFQSHGETPTKAEGDLQKEADSLFRKHVPGLDVKINYLAPSYPDYLVGLEKSYSDFKLFLLFFKGESTRPREDEPKDEVGPHLNVLRDITKSATINSAIALVLMPPLSSSSSPLNYRGFASLARAARQSYPRQTPAVATFCLYLEDNNILEKIPNSNKIGTLKRHSLFFGKKSDDGRQILWKHIDFKDLKVPTKLYDFKFGIDLDPSHRIFPFSLRLPLKGFDGSKSFTVLTRAKSQGKSPVYPPGLYTPWGVGATLLEIGTWGIAFRLLNGGIDAMVFNYYATAPWQWVSIAQENDVAIKENETFTAALVHDASADNSRMCVYYFNSKKIGDTELPKIKEEEYSWSKMHISLPRVDVTRGLDGSPPMWNGVIHDVQVYQDALTPLEIAQASERGN